MQPQYIVRLPNSVFKPYASIGTNLLFFEKGEPTKEVWFYEHRVPDGQKAYSMTKPIRFGHFQPCVEWWEKREESEVAWKVTLDEIKERGMQSRFQEPECHRGKPPRPRRTPGQAGRERSQNRPSPRSAENDSCGGAATMNPNRLLQYFERIYRSS